MTPDTTSSLVCTSPPEQEPLTLSEAKAFLRIEHEADDATITRAIAATREAAEHYMRLALLPQAFSYRLAAATQVISLPIGPAQTIAAITDTEDAVIGATAYRLTLDGFGVIFNETPPKGAIHIAFTAHYAADPSAVPALIKQGMLHHIAAMLENRQGYVPMPVQSLRCYQPYRRVRL